MKRLLQLIHLILLVTFIPLAGCNKQESASDGRDPIHIGMYGSLTGTTATFGQSTRKGVEMAAEEINARGGLLGGRRVVLHVEDDQGRPEEAQTVVSRLINRDRVVAVIGENASSRSLAAAPVCQQNQVPMVTPSSTNPRVTEVGNYIFRVCFIDPFQGFVMAKFAAKSLNIQRIGILRDIKNDYSVGLAEVFIENFQKYGGKITGNESYSEGDTDFSAQLTSLKRGNPEAIFIPGYYTEVGLIARQARRLGISVPLLGGDGWESPRLIEIGGEALNGCYYSNHFIQQTFVKRFQARYKETPDSVAALGYDAMRIVAQAISSAGDDDPSAIREQLASITNFPGATGTITINEKRNAVKPAAVLRIANGRIEYSETIEP